MALTTAYLLTTKNLESFFDAIRGARAPDRVNAKFLTQLDFTSSNDRLFIGLLKGLGLVDESGVPTPRYYAFLDQSESGRVLAEAIREAYEDLFAVNKKAHELSIDQVKNKLKTLTQGQKSTNVLGLMAATFKALCALADWTAAPPHEKEIPKETPSESGDKKIADDPAETNKQRVKSEEPQVGLQLHYDIHVHLPESRDPAVFDAIFHAMKKHLSV